QAMTADQGSPVGVYFGTSSGEIWGSRDEGRTWKCLAAHLPHVYAVEVA
ncbi:MAG TPA: glycosyl hydrolase, partial [Casimicrobiaceae bacterium]|nr:glycosyl hydrolase [Casimicrobiaceae bacterium]